MVEIRPYQQDAVDRTRRAYARKARRVLLQLATGAGKTICAAHMIQQAVEKGRRVLFLAHRRELIDQTAEKLELFGVPRGIIMAGEELAPADVMVASKDTLLSRCFCARGRTPRLELPPADLVVVDESHHAAQEGYQRVLSAYPNAWILGLSATPCLPNGKGLGMNHWDDLVIGCPTSRLVADGYLVPVRAFAPFIPDLHGVKPTGAGGDWSDNQLQPYMNQPTLVGDVVAHWLKLAERRPTLVFASGVDHSVELVNRFRAAGVNAEHIDADTEPDVRKDIIRRMRNGDIEVLSNVGIAIEGTDIPIISCVVLVRPTRSRRLFLQAVGRGMRTHPGKKDLLIIDHAGAILRHGWPDEDTEWTLSPEHKVEDAHDKKVKEGKAKEPICCPECSTLFSGTNRCPTCNHVLQRKAQVEVAGGNLVSVDRGVRDVPHSEKVRFWHRALACAANRDRIVMAAAMMFKDRFGCWPEQVTPRLPNLPAREQMRDKAADVFPQYTPAGREELERRRAGEMVSAPAGAEFEGELDNSLFACFEE